MARASRTSSGGDPQVARSGEKTKPPKPISEKERAFRHALGERIRAMRDRQQPLGIPVDQLVREAREEAYGDSER